MPKDALETYEKTLLYSKKKARVPSNEDRSLHNNDTNVNRTNENLTERTTKVSNYIGKDYVYRIPLTYFAEIELVHFLVKFNIKIVCALETNIKKIFE